MTGTCISRPSSIPIYVGSIQKKLGRLVLMLASKSRNWHRSVSSPLALALTVSLCAQALYAGPAQALSFISAKKSQLQTPMEAKLDLDAGPEGDTASGDTPAEPKVSATESKSVSKNKKETKKEVAKSSSKKDDSKILAPLTLTEDGADAASKEAPVADGDDKQYMKLHAETMTVAPKGPLDGDGHSAPTTLPSKSLKSEIGHNKGNLLEQAKNVNVTPMALQSTDAEMDQKTITDLDCERAQISDLWESTLSRNQDIQFVVQKLMPSSDKSHTTTALMRMISSTLATGISAGAMLSPSPAGYMTAQMGSSFIMQSMGLLEAKNNKKAQIDQGQAISLYKMVRDTADKVTETYRDYKKFMRKVDRTQTCVGDLTNMIQDARAGQDAAKQIEMEYTLSKAKGDVEEAIYDARRYRQSLIDLAGVDAVEKLDQSLQDQMIAEKELEKKTQIAEKPVAEPNPETVKKKETLKKLIDAVQSNGEKSTNM